MALVAKLPNDLPSLLQTAVDRSLCQAQGRDTYRFSKYLTAVSRKGPWYDSGTRLQLLKVNEV